MLPIVAEASSSERLSGVRYADYGTTCERTSHIHFNLRLRAQEWSCVGLAWLLTYLSRYP